MLPSVNDNILINHRMTILKGGASNLDAVYMEQSLDISVSPTKYLV